MQNANFAAIDGSGMLPCGNTHAACFNADTANYEWKDGSTDELVFAFAIDKAPLAATARNVTVDFGDDPATVVYPIDYAGFLGDDDETNALLEELAAIQWMFVASKQQEGTAG